MSKTIIDFEKGDTSALKDISDKLQTIIEKEGAIGEAWKVVLAAMNSNSAADSNKIAQIIDQAAQSQKNLATQANATGTVIDNQNKSNTATTNKLSDSIDKVAQSQKDVAAQTKATGSSLDAQNKNNSDTTNKLAQSIEQLSTASKSLDKSIIGGAYKNYLQQIQQQLGLTGKELINYIQNARQAAQAEILNPANSKERVDELTLSVQVMNETLKSMGVSEDGASKASLRLTSEIRNMKDELLKMAENGQKGTAAYEALKEKVVNTQKSVNDLNKEVENSASDTSNLDGVISIVSGVAGAYAVAQGAAALFGDENEDVAKALIKVQAAMSILSGIQEVANVLTEKSNANILLNKIFRTQNTEAIAKNTGALALDTEASVADAGAKTLEAGATKTATTAQEGLNVAMLASPMGVLVAGLLALYGAYEIYINTIGKASDAEARRKASIEALQEAQDKAADSIGKEEGELNTYIATAKNELLTREQRQAALDDAKSKFPGYLANINLENIATNQSTVLIAKQIELIKQKALAQAAGDVYAEKLKDQIKAENDLNNVIQNGISIGDFLRSSVTSNLDPITATILRKEQAVTDATNAANGAFDSQNKIVKDLGKIYESDADKLKDYIKELDDIIAHSSGLVKAFAEVAEAGAKAKLPTASTAKPFDQAAFDKEKQKAVEFAQYKIDVAKKGSAEELSARMALNEVENQEEIKRIQQTAGNDETAKEQLKVQEGKYLAQKNALNEEARQKDYASSLGFIEKKIDDEKAYLATSNSDQIASINRMTDLEIAAIKKRRDAALASATTSGDKDKINADANLAIIEAEKKKQTDILNVQKQTLTLQQAAAEKGSYEEYVYKLALLENEKQAEIVAAGKNKDLLKAIDDKYQKDKQDADIAFNVVELNNEVSRDNAALAKFGISEQEKLQLTIKRLDDQQAIEIQEANGNSAKIAEIDAKYDQQRRDATKASIEAELALRLNALQVYGADAKAANEKLINDSLASNGARLIANNELQLAAQAEIDIQKDAANQEYINKNLTYEQWLTKLKELKNQEDAINQKHADTAIQIFKDEQNKKLTLLEQTISVFQNSLNALDTGGLQTGLNSALTAFNQIAKAVNDYKIALSDPNADKTAAKEAEAQAIKTASIIGIQNTLNQLFSDSAAKRQQELSDNISALEDEKNAELNNANLTAKQKDAINAKYAAKEKEAKLAAWKADKQAKEGQIVIEGALNVVKAFPNPVLMALAAGLTFLELGVVEAQKPPKFRHGKVDINPADYKSYTGKINISGPGTKTSDSIPAMISKGETVIAANPTAKWKEALVAINNDHFEDYLSQKFKGFVFPHVPDNVPIPTGKSHEIDYKQLAKEVANQLKGIIPAPKSTHVNIDKNGIHTLVQEGNTRTEWKNKRFSMK